MNIKVTFADEKMEFRNAIMSGRTADGNPTACYVGKIDPDEIHTSLFYAHRAVIRLLVDHFGVPFEEVDSFLISALVEALTKEFNNRANDEEDMEVLKSMKFRRNHN